MKDECKEKSRRQFGNARCRQAKARQCRHCKHCPAHRQSEEAGAGELRAQSSGFDPQKRQHQQHNYRFGKIRPQQRAERRHGDADKH